MPSRCGSGRHGEIVQTSHAEGGLWRIDKQHVNQYVLNFFGLQRRPSRYICTACIEYARQQTNRVNKAALKHPDVEKAAVEGSDVGENTQAAEVTVCDVEAATVTTSPVAGDVETATATSDYQSSAAKEATATDDAEGQSGAAATRLVIELLKSGSMPQQSVTDLAGALGAALNCKLLEETHVMSSSFKDMNCLKSLSPSHFLQEREPAIAQFLTSVTAKKGKSGNETSPLRLAHVYEQLMGCRNARFVGPFNFSESLVKNTFRQSTSACALDSAVAPSGSTTTHKTFLSVSSAGKTKLQDGDIECWFDNNQVVGKSTRVSAGGKSLMSGCTMVCSIHTPGEDLQKDESLKPAEYESMEPEQLKAALQQVKETEGALNDTYRIYRLNFWKKKLSAKWPANSKTLSSAWKTMSTGWRRR